jgi:hypothetical protein
MKKQTTIRLKLLTVAIASSLGSSAWAINFQSDDGAIRGNIDSTVTVGFGVRASDPGCNTVIGTSFIPGVGDIPTPPSGTAQSGCLDSLSGYNDQGNLNYQKGQLFTEYLKGTHELIVRFPDDYKFMARGNWVRDFAATQTTDYVSGIGAPSLTDDARQDLGFKARLLDFWASKEFDINDERARVRIGEQVISWGESLFIPGGINQTNAMDLMRLSQPGTQLKEAFLPAPIASIATGLGHGVNVEAYVQTGWNANYFPPVGSYWSTGTIGKGAGQVANGAPYIAIPTGNTPKDNGQYGIAAHYQPTGSRFNLGVYAMNYHDKAPVVVQDSIGAPQYTYLEDRKLFGISANFPIGNWAIGSELSYRPKDAVPLNSMSNGGVCPDSKCYVEEAKYQLHLTALLQLTPGDYGTILNLLGADTSMLLAEVAAESYPNLQDYYTSNAGTLTVMPGAWTWGALNASDSIIAAGGAPGSAPVIATKNSWAYNFDYSWTYDGSLIPGWQVTPEIFYFQAVKGYSPSASGVFMEGAKSANYVLTFTQNPAKWVVGFNYAKFWGDNVFVQPLLNRDYYGGYASYNF